MNPNRALILNLFIPGAGLVPIRREWLGLLLALLFALCANIWIAGQWIAPLAIPRGLSHLALVIAILGWIAGQALYAHHARRFRAAQVEVDVLLAQALRDHAQGDLDDAQNALDAAMTLDSERPDVLAAGADLCESRGAIDAAVRLRKRLHRVAPRSESAARVQKSRSNPHSATSDSPGG